MNSITSSKTIQRTVYFIIALFFISCNSNTDTTSHKDYEQDLLYANNLNGNIKSIKTETFQASKNSADVMKGEKANPYLDLSTYLQDIIPLNSTIEFSRQGKEILREIRSSSSPLTIAVVYDNAGNIIERHFISDRYKNVTKYEIDDNRPISSTYNNEEGKVTSTSTFEYDNGLIKEITTTANDGEILDKTKFSYTDGVQTKKIYYASDKLIRSYKTDIHGRHFEILNPGGFINDQISIQYDGMNPFPTKILTYSDNKLENTLTLAFDEKGNISEIKEVGKEAEFETTYTYTHKYDSKGNWVERITYIDGDIKYLTTRTIKYY